MSDTSRQGDWTKPAAMAIPKGGFFENEVEQGRYGPIFPKTPACYGFSIIAKIIPGREPVFYEYARNMEKSVAAHPDILAVLKLHYLRWNLFDINGETYFQYIAFSTPTSTNIPRMRSASLGQPVLTRFSRISRAFQKIGKPTPRHSSSSSVTIIARAS
jgi:hypothetical protein